MPASLAAFARIRHDVARRLPGMNLPWHHGAIPSLRLALLRPALTTSVGRTHAMLLTAPPIASTAFEKADGHSFSLVSASHHRPHSASALAASLRANVLPAAQKADTRASYGGPWAAFLVYAFSVNREHEALPASRDLFQAFVALLISADLVYTTISRYMTAILDMHRRSGNPAPLPADELKDLRRAIRSQTGRPPITELPITVDILHAMLLLPTRNDQDLHDVLATATTTILACRPSDAVNIEPCDLLLDFAVDPPGTAAVRLWGMKNDPWRKGHHPRIGIARDPRKDILPRLIAWCARHNILPRSACTKAQDPSSSCTTCGTLFRTFEHGRPLPTSDPRHPMSTGMLTAAVRRVLSRLGYDPRAFTARSCRAGGLSAGGNVCLPDYMVTLQTGHARGNRSAPGYMTITDPEALFALWRAFRL